SRSPLARATSMRSAETSITTRLSFARFHRCATRARGAMSDDLPAIRLHNTLTRGVEPFVPKEPGKVGIYCCGPTTYDVAHVGHARAAITPDLLVRVLRHRGLNVT